MYEIQLILTRLYEISGLATFSIAQAAGFFLVVCAVFLFEMYVVGWKKSSLFVVLTFEKTTRVDFFIWLTHLFGLFTILSFLFSLGVCYFLAGQIQKSFNFELVHFIESGSIQFLIIYLISDLKEYWKHFIFHKWILLWEIHAFHHSAQRFNMLTAYRFHYLQTAIGSFFDVIPFVLLGAPIQTYFAVKILGLVHGLLVHSNWEHDWGVIGKYVLVSPAAHRIHHSEKKQHFNKNFGGTFIFWDRLFGTYHSAEPVHVLGIPDNKFNKKGLLHDLFLPVFRIAKRLMGRAVS